MTETRESKSRPHTGLVQTQFEVTNQRDEVVMTQSNWVIFGRRDASSIAPRRVPLRDKARVRQQDAPVPDAISSNPFLEDLIVGTTEELGTFTFSADDIVRFASQFDPQPFHIDAEAAKNSLFGGVVRIRLAYGIGLDEASRRPTSSCAHGDSRTRRAPGPPGPLAGFHRPQMVKAGLCRRHDRVSHAP